MGKTLAILTNKARKSTAELEQKLEQKTREAQNYRDVLEALEFSNLDDIALHEGSTRELGLATAMAIREWIYKAAHYENKFNAALDALQKYSADEAEELRNGPKREPKTSHLTLVQ